jgi:tetratricopeptide (TPR) repeat protein
LAGLVIFAPQLLGGVLPWTVALITGASLVCLAFLVLRAPAAQARFPRLGWLFLLLCAWTGVQALPLPCRMVAWLAPDSAAKIRGAYGVLHENASLCTLTQDPGATRLELGKSLAIAATFAACWLFAASGGRRRVYWFVAASTLAMSVVALGHALLEEDRVFGSYTPVHVARQILLAPLMNPNNLGAFAALGVPLWIGLTYRDSRPNVRLLGYVALALTSATTILSLSRGAIGQLVLSGLVMAWFVYRQSALATANDPRRAARPKRRTGPPVRELALATAGAAGLGVGAYVVGQDVLRDFRDSHLDKLDLIGSALRFAFAHGLTGVGRGAFSSAFISFQASTVRFTYAENFVAQWAADWGVPVTITILVMVARDLSLALRDRRMRPSLAQLGAVTGLAAWTAQNLVDFGFEMLGEAVVASALLAACVAPSADAAEVTEPATNRLWRGTTASSLALFAGGLWLALIAPRVQAEALSVLSTQLQQSQERHDRARFSRQLRAALHLHPAEPVLTLSAATESLIHRDPQTFAWLNRSMLLAPGWAQPHALAFRWLWQRGQGQQALLELKTAAAIDLNTVMGDACRLGRIDARWALAVAPDNQRRRAYFERASECLYMSAGSEDFDDALLREYPRDVGAQLHVAQRLQAQGESEAALRLLGELSDAYPDSQPVSRARFETLYALGHYRELIDGIERLLPSRDEATQVELLRLKALAWTRVGSPDLAREAVAAIRRRSTTDPQRLAQSYELEGRIHHESNELAEELTAIREAFRISNDTNYLRTIAGLAGMLGDRPQRLWAYIQLCQREPHGDDCERRNKLMSSSDANSNP